MQHPSSEKCFKLADIFEAVIDKYPKGRLNMLMTSVSDLREGIVNDGSAEYCGTVHCHAGWALVALRPELTDRPGEYVSFNEGVDAMDEFFFGAGTGHDNALMYSRLSSWAGLHPTLWGNNGGGCMFSSKASFSNDSDRREGAADLKDIADHWREVGKRLAKLEKLQERKPKARKNDLQKPN